MKKLLFIEDPGHAWLEVPMKEINALGIMAEISGFSYKNNGFAYLEEDCDYAVFVKAWERANGQKWNHTENTLTMYKENVAIRNYLSIHQ